ncbi:MAG: chemotaxis protein CheW, partial [Pseudoxanthomonas sp.]
MLSNDELRGVLVQTADERLLLPNTTVAEMMSRVPVEPLPDVPDWLVGQIAWQGLSVPVLSFARLAGLGQDPVGGNAKLLVLKALGGNPRLPYFALLTPSFPRLVSVPRDGLLADA